MTGDDDAAAPELRSATPQVFVTDVPRSVDFYRSTLGFERVYTYGDPPFYGEVRRGEAVLNLRHVDHSPFREGSREDEQLLSAAVRVSHVEELFEEYEHVGAAFQQRLALAPWGAHEFVVRDPDGNLILFGTPSPDRP